MSEPEVRERIECAPATLRVSIEEEEEEEDEEEEEEEEE